MKLLVVLAIVLFHGYCTSAVIQAAPIVYNVDLGGTSASGHDLHVIGTIEADPSTGQFITSNLAWWHNGHSGPLHGPSQFLSIQPLSYRWQATPSELRFIVDSLDYNDPIFTWEGGSLVGGDGYGKLVIGHGPTFCCGGTFVTVGFSRSPGNDSDSVRIYEVDPVVGLLIGTASVPEPSAFALVSIAVILVGGLAAGRKRINKFA